MILRLSGWLRLWIVVVAIYACLIAAYTTMSWPEIHQVRHDEALVEQMSEEASEILRRPNPKTTAELENALVEADRKGAIADAKELAQQIRDRRAHPTWESDPIILEMPNGHEFTIAGNTTTAEQTTIGKEYVRVLQGALLDLRIAAVRDAFLIWLVPSLLLLVLGMAIGWVYRGFKSAH